MSLPWWIWILMIVGAITIGSVVYLIVYGMFHSKKQTTYEQKENSLFKSEIYWQLPVNTMPKEGVKVFVTTIRNDIEIRYLEKVGDHVRVWKEYEDDIGIPLNEVVMWAYKNN